jgi:hypothetical protein
VPYLPPPPPSDLSYTPPPPSPPPPAPAPLFGPVDPGPDGWGPYGLPSAEPGWFFDVDLGILKPVLKNRAQNDTALPDGTILQLPTADQAWTVSPLFEVGYRLPNSIGLFALSYRFLASDGHSTLTNPAGNDFAFRSRLDFNVIDFDYGTAPYTFAPRWDWQWRLGFRYANVFFDSRVSNDLQSQQTSNDFTGGGPHARLDLYRHLAFVPGVSLFGRLDGAAVLGRITQKFRSGLTNPDGTRTAEFFEQNSTQMVPVLQVQAGLSYTPPGWHDLHFAAGYQFEGWWYVGQLGFDGTNGGTISASRGEFYTQGVFLRGQIDF